MYLPFDALYTRTTLLQLSEMVCSIMLPLVCREFVSLLKPGGASRNSTEDYSNYGFLYGTFPTAPSVFVYASHYNVQPDLVSVEVWILLCGSVVVWVLLCGSVVANCGVAGSGLWCLVLHFALLVPHYDTTI